MNTFKKKSLYAALAGVSALGVTGAAQAVSVNPDGLGQALIYPYYTVRDKVAGAPFNSLLSVVNSTASAKAVKVRVLEGRNSKEVLDFNLYLSAQDVWVAGIIPTAAGAAIFAPDNSCTSPPVPKVPANAESFRNFAYTGANADGADASLDRTREGYVEIIEMGIVTNAALTTDVTHVDGVAPCKALPTDPAAVTLFGAPTGGLFGGMTIINVLAGEDFAIDATALEGWSQSVQWTPPDSVLPTIASANPKTSVVTSGTRTYVTDWSATTAPANPVSAVLMHDTVMNEYVLEPITKSGTDWVLTMPTKRFYIANGSGNNAGPLFQRNFNGNSGSCDDVLLSRYDREERSPGGTLPGFSPPPPGAAADALCWEANVITFNNSNVLGSKLTPNNITTPYANGWMRVSIPRTTNDKHILVAGGGTGTSVVDTATNPPTVTAQAVTTYTGLPIVGFAAITYNNGTLTDATNRLIQSQYGGSFNHKQTRLVTGGTAGN